MNRVVAVVVALSLVLVPVVAAGPGGSPGAGLAVATQSFDRVQFVVTVFENGSARWTFHFERNLENESERSQFEDFATEFEANETGLYTDYRRRSTGLVAVAANATGRQMAARDFSRTAGVRTGLTERGVVEISFLWTAFAETSGSGVVVADVFEGGFYVPPDVWLVVGHGDGLAFDSVSPAPDSRSDPSLVESDTVTYRGERTFTDEHPRVEFVPAGQVSTDTPGDGGPPDGDGDGRTDGANGLLLAVAAVLALLVVGGVAVWRRGGAAVGDTGGGGGSPEPAVSDEELLTDEDRVLKLLGENGGRMKQVNIVEETGWSKSKVSMLLSEMEEEGRIDKLRVGRENIISLQGNEPDAAGSPHED